MIACEGYLGVGLMARKQKVVGSETCKCGRKITVFKTMPDKTIIYNYECNICRRDWQYANTKPEDVPIVGFPELPPAPPKLLHSGLRRNLKFDSRMRDMLAKFENGAKLTQIEYRYLLLFYGIACRLGEIAGQPYALFNDHVKGQHAKLVRMADAQGFTQSLLNMYGVMVEDRFDRFC